MNSESIRRIYKRPPIIEALCELHFSETQADSTLLGLFYEKVKENYPVKEELLRTNVDVQVVKGAMNTQRMVQEPLMRFFNKEGTELLQVANNLVTINRLPPYIDYYSFKESIKKAIEVYADVASPKMIDRIGLRYINHIFIPKTLIDLDEYFTYLPRIEDIYYQIRLNLQLKPSFDNHTVFTNIGSLDSHGTYLLEIYDSINLHQELNFDVVIEKIDEAHENIERIFEKVITPKTRELFEEVRDD